MATEEFERIPRSVAVNTDLLNFMRDECDFKIEHADGSFMDHLTFCRDYAAHHYKSQSPTPMLLHSIMGVGTNIFPMEQGKIPQLRKLVSAPDFAHIEAFPSIFRIVNNGSLLSALSEAMQRSEAWSHLEFHRLIDNQPLRLSAEEVWVQLNYQLIHALDFLPIANWSESLADGQFQIFARLFDILQRAGRLQAKVAWQANDGNLSLDSMVRGTLSGQDEGRDFMRKFVFERSSKIGHSLEFKLHLAANL
jgi:hypothetical protein